MDKEIVSYKCPNCAAPMVFGIDSQKWDCHFCGSSFTKEELDKLSEEAGFEKPEQADWTAELFNEDNMIVNSCPSCGGRVMSEKNTISTFCPFCHNPTVLASQLQGVYKPAKIIPFKIDKDEAMQKFHKLFRRRPFLPREFLSYLDKGEITGLYVPYWLYSSDMLSTMQAEGKIISSWSDSNYVYTKTDIYSLFREGLISFRYVPADASVRLDDAMMDAIEPFNYNDLENFRMEYLSGYFAEGYDVSAEEAKIRFLSRANQSVEQILREQINRFSSVRVTSLNSRQMNPDNHYALMPIWTISITYRDKIYMYALNAQTGKSAGRLPFSLHRIVAWFAGISATVSLIIAVILYFGGLLW